MPKLWRATGVLLALLVAGTAPVQMVDPAIDGLVGPFSYLARPSAILGGVGASGATQVTWDGALYTGAVELCVVTGDPPQPVAVRVKHLAGGCLPIVQYSWLDPGLRYTVSAFAAAPGEGVRPANFVRLQATRLEPGDGPASIGFALRHSGLDHRAPGLAQAEFSPTATYEFARGAALIDDRAVCVMPSPAPDRRYAVVGEPYRKSFTGQDFSVGPTTAVLLALWDLGKRDELTVDLAMPWAPLPPGDPRALQALRQARYDDLHAQIAEQWQAELGRGMRVLLPENKPRDTYQANLAQILMSAEIPAEASLRFHDRLRGMALGFSDAAALVEALDRSGRHDLARQAIEAWLAAQSAEGCLSPDGDILAHCAIMRVMASHTWLVGDREWAAQAYPKLGMAADWVTARVTVGRPIAELLAGYVALSAVGEMAMLLGQQEDRGALRAETDRLASLAQSTLGGDPLPPDALGGIALLSRALPDSPDPGVLRLDSEQVTELCRRLHLSYAEGLATREGLLDPVRTMEFARLHAIRGEQEQAIRDLYSVLVHTGSCHEGFRGGVRPWTDRDGRENWTPDPRFAGAYIDLLRDLLIREQRHELHLFSAVSPAWMQKGQMIGVHNAPTSFGLVTAALHAEEGGATLVMAADWHAAPSRVILHVPYFADVVSVSADRPGLRQVQGAPPIGYESTDLPAAGAGGTNVWLELVPDTTRVTIEWKLRPGAQLGYEAAVEEWREAYADRYSTYFGTGNDPVAIEPIPLR